MKILLFCVKNFRGSLMITRPPCQKKKKSYLRRCRYLLMNAENFKYQIRNFHYLFASDRNIDTNFTAMLSWTEQSSSNKHNFAASRHAYINCSFTVLQRTAGYGMPINILTSVTSVCGVLSWHLQMFFTRTHPAPDRITCAWIT